MNNKLELLDSVLRSAAQEMFFIMTRELCLYQEEITETKSGYEEFTEKVKQANSKARKPTDSVVLYVLIRELRCQAVSGS